MGGLALAAPWLLLALAALPALWWLLRVTPPAARRVRFPALRLLMGLQPREETAARTPWWLLALRLSIAALLIVGLADPVVNPPERLHGDGPLVLVIDTGWPAGATWGDTRAAARRWLDRAARSGKRVVVLPTARAAPDTPPGASRALDPAAARERVNALEPHPWPAELAAVREAVDALDFDGAATAVWLSDGVDAAGSRELAVALQRLGGLTVHRPAPTRRAKLLAPPDTGDPSFTVTLHRAGTGAPETVPVVARGADGRPVSTARARFAPDAATARATFDLPLALRNRVRRVAVRDAGTAGGITVLDPRWRRQRVGIAAARDAGRPLISAPYYLERAVRPFAQTRRAPLDELLDATPDVLILPDAGRLPADQRERLRAHIRDGGVAIRFAGPDLAAALAERENGQGKGLFPVPLRGGGRNMGGAMTWDDPARIAAFPDSGSLAGLTPPADVRVRKQVLARPGPAVSERTWARLGDGTPLVTGAREGDGWLVLVHTAADASWSDLPLSGTFVRILRRVSQLGAGTAERGGGTLPPHRLLDGFGELVPPYGAARALPTDADPPPLGPAHPPGLYGRGGGTHAHNLAPAVAAPEPLDDLPDGVTVAGLDGRDARHLGPWLIAAALALWLLDALAAMALRGALPRAGAAVLALGLVTLGAAPAPAQDTTAFAQKAAEATRLGYVETGVANVDRTARRGLAALSRTLARRTSVEPAEPMGVRLGRDPVVVFPMLYWPISRRQGALSEDAAAALRRFLDSGGTLVIDLREAAPGALGGDSPSARALRRLTRAVSIPPLVPVDSEHVLTKTFYLLQSFPGRTTGGRVWVEDTERTGSEVASVIIGANDWAGAWARDDSGEPLHAVTPGGSRQRELAYRVGVNLVMYALTGTYKADQVHVGAILERLEQ